MSREITFKGDVQKNLQQRFGAAVKSLSMASWHARFSDYRNIFNVLFGPSDWGFMDSLPMFLNVIQTMF